MTGSNVRSMGLSALLALVMVISLSRLAPAAEIVVCSGTVATDCQPAITPVVKP